MHLRKADGLTSNANNYWTLFSQFPNIFDHTEVLELVNKEQRPSPRTCKQVDFQLTVARLFSDPSKLTLHHLSNTISPSGVEYQRDDALSVCAVTPVVLK